MIGERLKLLREARDRNQKDFAGLLDTSSGYISELENNKKLPGSEFLLSLKRVFPHLNLNWFLLGEGERTIKKSPDSTNLVVQEETPLYKVDRDDDPITRKINNLLSGMPEDYKKDVLKYAKEKKQLADLIQKNKFTITGD